MLGLRFINYIDLNPPDPSDVLISGERLNAFLLAAMKAETPLKVAVEQLKAEAAMIAKARVGGRPPAPAPSKKKS